MSKIRFIIVWFILLSTPHNPSVEVIELRNEYKVSVIFENKALCEDFAAWFMDNTRGFGVLAECKPKRRRK